MSDSSAHIDKNCTEKCDLSYRECLKKGEDETVCRMKRVPCDCACAIR